MAAPSSFGSYSDIAQAGTGVVNTIYQIIRDQHLSGAQREANQFNADQAALERAWSSSEADIARQWQEEQYLKYNSPQAMIRQYQDAGLNPALMYQNAGGAAANTNSPVPSGTAATSVTPAPGDVAGALGMLYGLFEMRSRINANEASANASDAAAENSRASAREHDANATGIGIDNETRGARNQAELDIKNATKSQIDEATRLISAQCDTEAEKKAVEAARKVMISNQGKVFDEQAAYEHWKNEFRKEYGYSPDTPAQNALVSLLGKVNKLGDEGKQGVAEDLIKLLKLVNGWYHEHSTDPITPANPEIPWMNN